MLTSDELIQEWKTDSSVDPANLRHQLYSHTLMHCKYLNHLQGYKMALRKYGMKYARIKQLKTRYYNGELTKEELVENGLEAYLFRKPLKGELETLLDSDSQLQELQEKTLHLEMLVASTESIMKDISNRYYLFRSIIDYEKFQSGG